MWKILCKILSVPHNTIMAMNNVMNEHTLLDNVMYEKDTC